MMRWEKVRRFWSHVQIDDNCWLWTGPGNGVGYGTFYWDGKRRCSHRISYELLVGAIPEGLVLDHLCRTPSCVNPGHLEPVTHRENIRRGAAATKTVCKYGHPYNEINTYVNPTGARACRVCKKLNQRRYLANKYHR